MCRKLSKIIKDTIKVGHKPPNLLHTDKGLEFKNKEFNSLMKKYSIKLYHTENEENNSIIERYNKTQNNRIKVIFEINTNFRWVNILDEIITDYNNAIRRTIGMKPKKVNKYNAKELLETIFKYTPPDLIQKPKCLSLIHI